VTPPSTCVDRRVSDFGQVMQTPEAGSFCKGGMIRSALPNGKVERGQAVHRHKLGQMPHLIRLVNYYNLRDCGRRQFRHLSNLRERGVPSGVWLEFKVA
jgi:hypothetical protein